MPEIKANYYENLNANNHIRHRLRKIITGLSLAVVLIVFWSLKLTGIGIAGEAFCGQPEHTHTEECQTKTLICPLTEEESPHVHGEECFAAELICTLTEEPPHTHTEECFVQETVCTPAEGEEHTHEEGCFAQKLICPLPEEAPHTHEEACYAQKNVCTQEEGVSHIHTEDCYAVETTCQLAEHIHLESCYSDLTADIETADDWRMLLLDMARGPTVRQNVVLVARSQLDYTESELNFQVDAQGIRRGITRYGQWYGNPYGDWSAMFVSFCLHYAGAWDLPANAGPEAMRLEWEAEGMYEPANAYEPAIGNLVFLKKTDTAAPALPASAIPPAADAATLSAAEAAELPAAEAAELSAAEAAELPAADAALFPAADTAAVPAADTAAPAAPAASANAVAIITGIDDTVLTVIEGDADNTVRQTRYLLNDPALLGYGIVPDGDASIKRGAPIGTRCTVWLDGTNGALEYLTGSPNTAYQVRAGDVITLPAEWTSPSKYSYRLRGWYDISNSRYYPAGAEYTVTDNAVLYADWVASTYDLGVFNTHVADTVSTNSFITTHMFDYNYLFNLHSLDAQINVNSNSHSETWSMITSGTVDHGKQPTLDFIFSDNDASGHMNMPNNRSDRNMYHEADTVTRGIYTAALGEILFSTDNAFDPQTGTGIMGKTYLGTADHLFQLESDTTDQYYGYYYYDSHRNAASYSQSNSRFYVYDYLSATSDSIGAANADFIPLNSPYANTNGKTVGTYNYNGVDGEYQGVPHYRFDSKYNSGDHNSTNNVSADYAYAMRSDIYFYLPNAPGSGGNKDLYGNDMEFRFSGDDDLWVLIDGKVALDIGGIHQDVGGIIDFSTGTVTVNGVSQPSLMDLGIGSGDHVMTVLYLERGSSMSNCSIYFNLAPRFGMQLKKEDVLTQQLLDGAQFTIYTDYACTQPAELWVSEAAYEQDLLDGVLNQSQSTFTVVNGTASLWGLGSGNTYYLKETSPPFAEGYGIANGVIELTIEKDGLTTYHADILNDAQGNAPSNGYTIHDVHIDETTKTVYITVTNAPESVTEITTAQVLKTWKDSADHSGDYIQAYLTVTDPDGTVRRIREVTLSDENDWMYIWTNLPRYDYTTLSEVQYGIEESYESGYYSTVRRITEIVLSKTEWVEALSFQNGETYILRTANGYLSTLDNKADTGYKWVDENTAKTSPNALWTTTVSNNNVKFTNGVGQTITFYYNNGNPTDFFATSDPINQYSRQEFSYSNRNGALQIYYRQNNTSYYLAGSMTSAKKFNYNTNANNSLLFTPKKLVTQTDIRDVADWAYQITNTPLPKENETAVAVKKEWKIPEGYTPDLYQEFDVTVRLYANGINTGRTLTLNLKNNWRGSFQGLPYTDENGEVVHYTVQEVWSKDFWTVHHGEIVTSGGSPPTYSTVITNSYYAGGPELPSTGSAARMLYVLCGSGIMLGSLVYGIGSRRKRERRMK